MELSPSEIRQHVQATPGQPVVLEPLTDDSEYARVLFSRVTGNEIKYYDLFVMTLRLHYEEELHLQAEEAARQVFPDFDTLVGSEGEPTPAEADRLEEISLFLAEKVEELEGEGEIKVREFMDRREIAPDVFEIEIALHVPVITQAVIDSVTAALQNDRVNLDPTLYSFQVEEGGNSPSV